MNGTGVTELRLVVTTDHYDEAVAFYRDALGLPEKASYEHAGGHLTLLDAGRATIEIVDPRYAAYIDEVEVGKRTAGHIRVAFHVADAGETTERLVEAGAQLLAAPARTPWGSLNSRLDAPGALQLTLFENSDEVDE